MQPSASNHPVVPSDQQINEWESALLDRNVEPYIVLERAFQAGADQELEACLGEVSFLNSRALADRVRAARRPKPPSLKEQALEAWERQMASYEETDADMDTIRRALEALPND